MQVKQEEKNFNTDYEAANTSISISAPKKTLIIDSHPILQLGLVTLINSQPTFTACDETISYKQAIPSIKYHQPDLIIIDIKMDGKNGFKLVKQLKAKHARLPILVYCIHNDPVFEERALSAGANGYVSKESDEHTLLKAIGSVLAGHTYMSTGLRTRLSNKLKNGSPINSGSPLELLSNRELQVFSVIGQGLGTREIATHCKVSIKTIESHKEHIKKKLSLKSYTELAKRAIQWFETSS